MGKQPLIMTMLPLIVAILYCCDAVSLLRTTAVLGGDGDVEVMMMDEPLRKKLQSPHHPLATEMDDARAGIVSGESSFSAWLIYLFSSVVLVVVVYAVVKSRTRR